MLAFDNYDQDLINLLMTSLLFLIFIFGVIGNAVVLVVGIVKKKYHNNVTNCYIMNLAVTDLLFLLISVPLTVYLGMSKVWNFGELMCKMHIYLAHVLLQATCLTLAAMSIDRYLNIVHEQRYRPYRKSNYTFYICILIWTVSGLFMFPYGYVFRTNEEKKNTSSTDCTVNDDSSFFSSCLFTFGFYYVLPLTIIVLCYSRVLIHIRRKGCLIAKRMSGQPRRSVMHRHRRVQRMLLGLTLAFALCWLPIHILELLHCSRLLSDLFYSRHLHTLNAARIIAHGLSYFNSCLNPYLYAILNKSYFSARQTPV